MIEFSSVVSDIREEFRVSGRQRWQIALETTKFAAGDTGLLEAVARSGTRLTAAVLEVFQDDEGQVWHAVEKPLAAGTTVTGRVREAAVRPGTDPGAELEWGGPC